MATRDVHVRDVFTYVETGRDKTAFGVCVPPFASHWGVVVGRYMYHLIFVDPRDAATNSGDTTGQNSGKRVRFHAATVPEESDPGSFVGTTIYDADKLVGIGEKMITEFGSYHRVFWNCQMFARCYLRVITQDRCDFNRYNPFCEPTSPNSRFTSSDALTLFLCPFMVSTPTVTTLAVQESRRVADLVAVGERFIDELTARADVLSREEPGAGEEVADPSVLRLSDIGIGLIRETVCLDSVVDVGGSSGSGVMSTLTSIIRYLFGTH